MQRKSFRQMRMNSRRQAYENFGNSGKVEESGPREKTTLPEPPKKVNEPSAADFQAGLIVKIVLDEPISDAKRFKVLQTPLDSTT